MRKTLKCIYVRRKVRGKVRQYGQVKSREEKRGRERVRRKQIRVREILGKSWNIVFLPMICGWGRKTAKVARCRAWISFRSRSASRSDSCFLKFPCCDEWAVHSVICCPWCENWNEFSWCSTQCAHGLVKTWWCQWLVCWMGRAQCDLLTLVENSNEFSACSPQCAHGVVKIRRC